MLARKQINKERTNTPLENDDNNTKHELYFDGQVLDGEAVVTLTGIGQRSNLQGIECHGGQAWAMRRASAMKHANRVSANVGMGETQAKGSWQRGSVVASGVRLGVVASKTSQPC